MTTTATGENAVVKAVWRLDNAQQQRTPCPPVRDILPAGDLAAAYAVQAKVIANRRGRGRRSWAQDRPDH